MEVITSCKVFVYPLCKLDLLSSCFSDRNLFVLNTFLDVISQLFVFLDLFFSEHCVVGDCCLFMLIFLRDFLDDLALVFLLSLLF